jgi:hypothetical protein
LNYLQLWHDEHCLQTTPLPLASMISIGNVILVCLTMTGFSYFLISSFFMA